MLNKARNCWNTWLRSFPLIALTSFPCNKSLSKSLGMSFIWVIKKKLCYFPVNRDKTKLSLFCYQTLNHYSSRYVFWFLTPWVRRWKKKKYFYNIKTTSCDGLVSQWHFNLWFMPFLACSGFSHKIHLRNAENSVEKNLNSINGVCFYRLKFKTSAHTSFYVFFYFLFTVMWMCLVK